MQLRARKAREMLQRGISIADAACMTGFTDQSHLNRIFKRLMGYTPGQFSNSVQDAGRRISVKSLTRYSYRAIL